MLWVSSVDRLEPKFRPYRRFWFWSDLNKKNFLEKILVSSCLVAVATQAPPPRYLSASVWTWYSSLGKFCWRSWWTTRRPARPTRRRTMSRSLQTLLSTWSGTTPS